MCDLLKLKIGKGGVKLIELSRNQPRSSLHASSVGHCHEKEVSSQKLN